MSKHPVRALSRSTWRCPGAAWALLLLLIHTACATGMARSGVTAAMEFEAAAEVEVTDKQVRLSLPTRFGAVRVSDSELEEALTALVLNVPLRVASAHAQRFRHPEPLLTSVPVLGETWRTPLARAYGSFCARQGTPGDCLELFVDGPGLDDADKCGIALALSVNTALEARDAELRGMLSTTRLWTTLSITLSGYMALLAAPEPVSKGVAAALAVLMWGYLGWELFDLVRAYVTLRVEAAEANTFAELREAGERFGKVIGPNSVRILLLLGAAAVGETAALVSKAPKLPGFTKASGALKSHAGIRDALAAAQEADMVKIATSEGAFKVVLPAHVLAMAGDGPSKSEHARQRQMQGRPVGAAFNDATNARPADVFIQSEDGRFVVRGANGREHIFEPDGTLVTTVDGRSAAAHGHRLQSGILRRVTEDEFSAFKSLFGR